MFKLDIEPGSQRVREAPSINVLSAPLFTFTSDSSALLGRPRCGLSI